MAMWKDENEMFALIKEKLYTPVVGDILDQTTEAASFASIAGALLYAHRNYEEKSIFKKILKGLFN